MNRTLTAISAAAFLGLTACASTVPELDIPAKQNPLPEFTQQEERNVLAMVDFMRCTVNQGGASIVNSPWFDIVLEACADMSDLTEDMLYDVFEQFQTRYGHSWPDMVRELLDGTPSAALNNATPHSMDLA